MKSKNKKGKKTELEKSVEKLKTISLVDNIHKLCPPTDILKENTFKIIYCSGNLVLFEDKYKLVYILDHNGFCYYLRKLTAPIPEFREYPEIKPKKKNGKRKSSK